MSTMSFNLLKSFLVQNQLFPFLHMISSGRIVISLFEAGDPRIFPHFAILDQYHRVGLSLSLSCSRSLSTAVSLSLLSLTHSVADAANPSLAAVKWGVHGKTVIRTTDPAEKDIFPDIANDPYYINILDNIILPNKILKGGTADDTSGRTSPYGNSSSLPTPTSTSSAAASTAIAALEPHIIFATLMNTHETMTCLHLMKDCQQIASGYTDSIIRLWSHNKEIGRDGAGGREDEEQLLYEEGYHTTSGGGSLTTVLPRALLTSMTHPSPSSSSAPPVKFHSSSAGSSSSHPNASSARHLPGHKNTNPNGFPYSLELRGHTQRILSVCHEEYTSPTGRIVLSSSADETIRLWDTYFGQCVAKYYTGEGVAWSVSFSPVGYYFLSANQSRTASLFCTERPDALRIFRGHTSDVTCCAWHPNLSYFVTGSDDRTARLWDVRTKADTVRCFSPLAPYVSPGSLSGSGGANSPLSSLIASLSPVSAVQVSPCGSMLAVGYEDSTVITWDIPQNKITGILIQETATATAAQQKKKRKHQSSSTSSVPIPPSAPLPASAASGATSSPTTGGATSGSGSGSGSGLSINHNKYCPIYSLSFSSESNSLVTGAANGTVNIFNLSAVNYLQLFNQRNPLTPTNREVKEPPILISPHHSYLTKHTPVYAVQYGTNNLISAGGALSLPSY
jgi:WD40 repeat protein